MFSVCVERWGRGHPEEYTEAIAIGEEKFDVDSDKKPRAGQILWIRGLTRLQTQVSLCTIELSICARVRFGEDLKLYITFVRYVRL